MRATSRLSSSRVSYWILLGRDREALSRTVYRDIVRRALDEDIGDGDITTDGDGHAGHERAACSSSRPTACSPVSTSRSKRSGSSIRMFASTTQESGRRGLPSRRRDRRASSGSAAALLVGERTALNFLQRLSRHRDAHPAVRRRGRRPASPSSTPARRRRRCACWRSTRCARAAARITASACSTPC